MESFMKTHNSPAYHWIYSGKMIFLLRNDGWWYYISWKKWIPFVDSDFPKLPLSAKAVAKAAVRGKTPGRYQRRWVYSLVLDGEYFLKWVLEKCGEIYTCSISVTNFIDFRLRWLDNVVSALISPCHLVINQVPVGEVYPKSFFAYLARTTHLLWGHHFCLEMGGAKELGSRRYNKNFGGLNWRSYLRIDICW